MEHLLRLEDFNSICRTCLQNKSKLTSLFESCLSEMLNTCEFWTVSADDGFPYHMCENCVRILETSYTFKLQCWNSYTILKNVIENDLIKDKERDKEFINVSRNDAEDTINSINQEPSLGSNDWNDDDLLTNRNQIIETEDNSNTNCNNKATEENQSDKAEDNTCDNATKQFNEDSQELISFLDQPLPAPFEYSCEKCKHSFKEKNDLFIHGSIHNDDLMCLVCSKKCRTRKMLKRHIKSHMKQKAHICTICGKGFSESYGLTKHSRQHAGIARDKKHLCPDCGKSFTEPYYLNLHLRKHTGERPFVCEVCNKAFADPRSFKLHNMAHNGDKPHKCQLCPKAFTQSSNLRNHERIHTGERPYSCKYCPKTFLQNSSLEKHYKTHRNKQNLDT